MGEVTELLEKARAGEAGAWDRAVALVYQDLRRIARGVLAGGSSATLDATGLVHECYERMARQEAFAVNNRAHFLALAARAITCTVAPGRLLISKLTGVPFPLIAKFQPDSAMANWLVAPGCTDQAGETDSVVAVLLAIIRS